MADLLYWTYVPITKITTLTGTSTGKGSIIYTPVEDAGLQFGFPISDDTDYAKEDFMLFVSNTDMNAVDALSKVRDLLIDAGVNDFAAITYLRNKENEHMKSRQVLVMPASLLLKSAYSEIVNYSTNPWQLLLLSEEPTAGYKTQGFASHRQFKRRSGGYGEKVKTEEEEAAERLKFFRQFKNDEYLSKMMVVVNGKEIDLKIETGVCTDCFMCVAKAMDRCGPCIYNCLKAGEFLEGMGCAKDGKLVDGVGNTYRANKLVDKIKLKYYPRALCIFREPFERYVIRGVALTSHDFDELEKEAKKRLTQGSSATVQFKKEVCTRCILGTPKNYCMFSGKQGQNCTGPFGEVDVKKELSGVRPELLAWMPYSGTVVTLDESLSGLPTDQYAFVYCDGTTAHFMLDKTPIMWKQLPIDSVKHLLPQPMDIEEAKEKFDGLPVITRTVLYALQSGEIDKRPQLCNEAENSVGGQLVKVEIDSTNQLVATYRSCSHKHVLRFNSIFNLPNIVERICDQKKCDKKVTRARAWFLKIIKQVPYESFTSFYKTLPDGIFELTDTQVLERLGYCDSEADISTSS